MGSESQQLVARSIECVRIATPRSATRLQRVRPCSGEKEVSPCGARGIDGWRGPPLCAQRQCMLQEKQGAMNAGRLIEFN
jgi:hypothetical protein